MTSLKELIIDWLDESLSSFNMVNHDYESIELPDLLSTPEVSVSQSLDVFAASIPYAKKLQDITITLIFSVVDSEKMVVHSPEDLLGDSLNFRQPPELYIHKLPDDYEPRVWEQYRSFDATKFGLSDVYAYYQSVSLADDDPDAYNNTFVFKYTPGDSE